MYRDDLPQTNVACQYFDEQIVLILYCFLKEGLGV